jgi:hypothetical protein
MRRPRKVPLSRLIGATPTRAAAPVEVAELGQLGDQRARGDRADARDRGQQVLGGAPHRRAPDGVVEVTLDPGESLVQPDKVGVEVALQAWVPSLAAAVALGADHLHDLAPAGDQLGHPLRLGVGERPGAKSAIVWASRASVLARRPSARAKSRICRGLTTASGSLTPLSAAATVISKPPVASRTTKTGCA